jgi:hypothetical protein
MGLVKVYGDLIGLEGLLFIGGLLALDVPAVLVELISLDSC